MRGSDQAAAISGEALGRSVVHCYVHTGPAEIDRSPSEVTGWEQRGRFEMV